ncbi:hypothetical protein K1X84_02110 [bacterium]|nr:hypothetical protein [bacterium]
MSKKKRRLTPEELQESINIFEGLKKLAKIHPKFKPVLAEVQASFDAMKKSQAKEKQAKIAADEAHKQTEAAAKVYYDLLYKSKLQAKA